LAEITHCMHGFLRQTPKLSCILIKQINHKTEAASSNLYELLTQ